MHVKMSDVAVKSREPKLEQMPQDTEKEEKAEYARTPFKKIIKHHSS